MEAFTRKKRAIKDHQHHNHVSVFERDVTDVAGQQHHDEDEAGDHRAEIDFAGEAEKVAVEAGRINIIGVTPSSRLV